MHFAIFELTFKFSEASKLKNDTVNADRSEFLRNQNCIFRSEFIFYFNKDLILLPDEILL